MTWKGNLTSEAYNGEVRDDLNFNVIRKMEEKRTNFNQEAMAIHEAAVKEWDTLYAAIVKIAEQYKDSEAFKSSMLFKKFFDTSAPMPPKMKEPIAYVDGRIER